MIYTMMSCVEAKYLLLSGEIKKKNNKKQTELLLNCVRKHAVHVCTSWQIKIR